jgi:hypothetical protein
MVEAYVKENKGYFAYCDTDALFVNPELSVNDSVMHLFLDTDLS